MNYSLKITGFALDGFNLEKAKNDFATLFKIDNDRVNQIFSAGKDVTIKKSMSKSDALFYHKKINEIGLENIIVQPDGVPLELSDREDDINDCVFNVKVSDSISWIKTGITLFRKCPLKWLLTTLSWLVPIISLGIIPVIGQLVSAVFLLSMLPGLMYAAEQIDNGHDFKISGTFKALKKATPLFVFYIFSITMITLPIIWGVYSSATGGIAASILPWVIAIVVFIAVMMGYFFSGPLIVLKKESLIRALKLSFQGSIKNILPLFIFSTLIILIQVIGILLLGIGLLITTPIVMAAFYAAYRDIYLRG